MMRKITFIFLIISMFTVGVTACKFGNGSDATIEEEIAIAVALTQTAFAAQNELQPIAETKAAETPTLSGDNLQPIDPETCTNLMTAISQNLAVPGEQNQAPIEDEFNQLSGTGCQIKIIASGVDFEHSTDVQLPIQEALQAQGWQEDVQYMAIGPGTEIRGFRNDNGLCKLWTHIQAVDDALCSEYATIAFCWPNLQPEQRLISATLICAQGNLPEFIPQVSELQRVEFREGSTEIQLEGSLLPNNVHRFVLFGEAEREIHTHIYPPGAVTIAVVGADGKVLKSDINNLTDWSGLLHASQDYYISVRSVIDTETAYTVDVSIPPLEPIATTGEVSGTISFPDEAIPPLHIVAYSQESGLWYFLKTSENSFTYLLPGLPPGKYTLIAYAQDGRASSYPADVSVIAGETTEGVYFTDWGNAANYLPDPVGW